LVAEAPLFSGGGTERSCCQVTMQSGRATLSPTVSTTTTVYPDFDSAPDASEYFCPTTLGDDLAWAGLAACTIVMTATATVVAPITADLNHTIGAPIKRRPSGAAGTADTAGDSIN
jgi:hypothetical protein